MHTNMTALIRHTYLSSAAIAPKLHNSNVLWVATSHTKIFIRVYSPSAFSPSFPCVEVARGLCSVAWPFVFPFLPLLRVASAPSSASHVYFKKKQQQAQLYRQQIWAHHHMHTKIHNAPVLPTTITTFKHSLCHLYTFSLPSFSFPLPPS